MKTILYATDYSENSIAALKYAHAMSLKLKAKLWVIHVYDYPKPLRSKAAGLVLDFEKDAFREHTAKLEDFCKRHLGKDIDQAQVEVEAIHNTSAIQGVISKAEKIQSLFIVTGMKGESQLRRLIMGSTARDLIDQAPYPVLTIPQDTSYNAIETIIYATDFQEEDLDAIQRLAEIAKLLEAKVIVTHVAPRDQPITEVENKLIIQKIDQHVKSDNVAFDIVYSDDIFNELKLYFRETNADIIAMLERESTSLMSELFHKSLNKKMKSYGRIPLMSFNAKNYGKFHL